VAQRLAQLKVGPHVMDGEVCVLDELGRSDYNRLRGRAIRRCFYPECDPVEPLEIRKARLAELLTPATDHSWPSTANRRLCQKAAIGSFGWVGKVCP
jgi:hypothetical protein